MSEASPEETTAPHDTDGDTGLTASPQGMSPYATGGGGVTFERKVAVKYLAHLLVGDGTSELGDGRSVVSVEFQQAPDHPVDDLVVTAAYPDESLPSLVLALGIRRSPNLVPSDESTRKLIQQFVRAVMNAPTDGPKHRLGLVVAGPQPHADQLAKLAGLAAVQMDAPRFFDLVRTPGKFDAGTRERLDQLEKLVKRALHDLGVTDADTAAVQQHAWELLRRLTVCMPRLESPDETDWSAVTNSLIRVARRSDLLGASRLRDRLVALASEYPPKSARVDLKLLRRDAHAMLDPTTRRHQRGWEALDHLHKAALASVRDEITASDGARRVCLDRSAAAAALLSKVADAAAVIVSGESGVGKSALALLGAVAAGEVDPYGVQPLCVNLRHVPKLTVQFEATLGSPVSTLLGELSASQRMLIVDGADAVTEGMESAFRYLVDAAQASDVKVIAVTSVDSLQVVRDTLAQRFGPYVAEYAVAPLTDSEIDTVVETFPELSTQNANPRTRELLRRLVVLDLLVRARVRDVALTDADAMRAVWSALVRRNEVADRGSPDARELALLRLADQELKGDDRLDSIREIDPAALDGLRRDGLLRTSPDDPFKIGPEFAHEEVRRYSVARLLLSGDTPTSGLLQADAPRWSLSAVRLACQVWLARPETVTTPVAGRFAALQESFDVLVDAGHVDRWGDVPGEALLALADPEAMLRDAWPGLLVDDAAGLRRLARLIDQRHRGDNGIVHVIDIEPIVTLLLDDHAPWRSGKHAENLLREWLHAHVVANTCEGHPLRIRLRDRLVEECALGDRRLAKEQDAEATRRAARTPEEVERERRLAESQSELFAEIGYGDRRRRQQPKVPREIKDRVVLELLALLGPDLGDGGGAILHRVARDAPSWLAPAVEEPLTGRALASYSHRLLAQLIQVYYLDDEADGSGFHDDGIRRHHARNLWLPLAAWYRGPFMPLFQTDFHDGVAVLNRLLNHAARTRAQKLARLGRLGQPLEGDRVGPFQTQLEITGARQRYVGDEHVWRWYRGTGVGPYPCISALQALERVCDELIKSEVSITTVVSILLDGCESLAMPGLVVGLLVRHLETAESLLDPYLTEPFVWRNEVERVVSESERLAAASEGLVAPERRNWSLREAAAFMALRANADRAAKLRALGQKLVANALRNPESTAGGGPTEARIDVGDSTEHQIVRVRAWASSLDRDTYRLHEAPDGMYVQSTPPDDIAQALEPANEELQRAQEATRLLVRYFVSKKEDVQVIGPDELVVDIAAARKLFENPPSHVAHDPWDACASVTAAALEAHFLNGVDLPVDALSFAADILFRIGEREPGPRQYEFEDTFFGMGADRSAARALPLLFLPAAAGIRAVIDEADGWSAFERAARAGINLAQAVANEVRLHLARGLDHVWKTPCVHRRCHHDVAWRIATETMRHCVLAARTPHTVRTTVVALKEPLTKSLAKANDRSILAPRLDAAIRTLAPAAMANICVSTRARDLLMVLLAAQRRSLLSYEHDDADHRGSHTLMSARALLTMAERGEDAGIYDHINAYSDNSALLGTLLRALSAAAEETPNLAATARGIWPNIVRHVLAMNDSEHPPFQDHHHGDTTLAALVPNAAGETSFLYREVQDNPITWWDPLAMQSEVEAWIKLAAGRAFCVDHLVGFLRVLPPEDQVRTGLSWMSKLVLADPAHAAGHSFVLPHWLIDKRTAALEAGLSANWQEVVDALVVAGVTRLAAYSV